MNSRIVKGSLWTARKIDEHYIVSLKDKANIIEALKDFINNEKIKEGKISGIGILEKITLRFLDPYVKKYLYARLDEPVEAQNMYGSISIWQDRPVLCLDLTMEWENETVLSGQLMEAKVYGHTEFLFYSLSSTGENMPQNKTAGFHYLKAGYWSIN